MAALSLAGLLILASCVTIASCLQCYHCVREDEPHADKYCEISNSSLGNNTPVNCSAGEERCQIVKTILKDSSVTLFKRMCAKEEDCTNKCSDADAEGRVICNTCCDKDMCNKGVGPKAAEQSGTSRITVMRAMYTLGGFLVWFFL
ncbi:Ly6 PLAUR domain-containing protein [Desmophyllum pertusum]|uniref:Ly6 PLAUR domain-containing protein n=1 Tax=Desmophyllum pertusum TaxID=174260 RepID=A0A9X0CRX9_9CNID|nr:Ly6 PLAUR domain-containing protein [Desmophyllum pertusum]